MNDNGLTYTVRGYDPWNIRTVENGYEVYDDGTYNEKHFTMTYPAAHFLKNQFNDQYHWFTYERFYKDASSITIDNNSSVTSYSVWNQPQANVKLFFGDNAQETNTYFQFHLRKPPNKVQRWLMHKFFGMKMVLI